MKERQLPKFKKNANNTVDDRERRKKDLSCSYCRPNKGENTKHRSKHGKGKARYKTERKGR